MNGVKGRKGFERDSDSMRFGVRIGSNIINELKNKQIDIQKVILDGFDKVSVDDTEKVTTGVYGTFKKREHLEVYLNLKNKRNYIEKILMKRLLER